MCELQDHKCLYVIIDDDTMGSCCTPVSKTTEDQWRGECGGRGGSVK